MLARGVLHCIDFLVLGDFAGVRIDSRAQKGYGRGTLCLGQLDLGPSLIAVSWHRDRGTMGAFPWVINLGSRQGLRSMMAVLSPTLIPPDARRVLVGRLHRGGWERCKLDLESRFLGDPLWTFSLLHPQSWGVGWFLNRLAFHPQRFLRWGHRTFILDKSAGCEHFNQLLEGCNVTGWDMEVSRGLLKGLLNVHDSCKDEISSGG